MLHAAAPGQPPRNDSPQPSSDGGVDVCYVISHGINARMILQSGIVSLLRAEGLSVAIAVPTGSSDALAQYPELADVEVVELTTRQDRFPRLLESWHEYLFNDLEANPRMMDHHNRRYGSGGRRRQLRGRVRIVAGRLAGRVHGRRALRRIAERALAGDAGLGEPLGRLRPRVVVATSPHSMYEAAVLAAARRHGATTVDQVMSWDNVTTKGRLISPADAYLVWGPMLAEEVVEYYDADRDHVHSVGVPHFAAHLDRPADTSMVFGRLLTDLGLRPDRPTILFTLSLPVHTPNELDIVEWLAERVRSDHFGPEVQVLVRPHPQALQGTTSADRSWRARLEAVATGERVGLWLPSLERGGLSWQLSNDDLYLFAEATDRSVLCLNSGSTTALEAVLHGCPVIVTAFDGSSELPPRQSIRRVLGYTHMRKILAFDVLRLTSSFTELDRTITELLGSESVPDAEALLAHIVGPDPRTAARRTVDALRLELELAQGRR